MSKAFLLNVLYKEDDTEVQDIDLCRFIPTEVDNSIGITVATMDRFTSRNKTKPTATEKGETYIYYIYCHFSFLVGNTVHTVSGDLVACLLTAAVSILQCHINCGLLTVEYFNSGEKKWLRGCYWGNVDFHTLIVSVCMWLKCAVWKGRALLVTP